MTRTGMRASIALAALAIAGPASGQSSFPTLAPGVKAAGVVLLVCDATARACAPASAANPMPVPRESFQLVAASTPSPAATVFGGDYILSQTCTAYGTLALQVLGPDGTTWQTIITKTASDTAGGTGLSLGSYAQVRVTVTGTTGCNALLARVPA